MMMNERQPTALIIDDDSVVRLLAREVLEQSGWMVDEAENGRIGLEAFVGRRPDLVLLDIVMPERDGFTVCTELRRLPEGMHIPVLSAQAIAERKPDYLVILAWNFAKPIIEKNAAFRERGGRFIVPVPKVEVV